MPSFNGHAIARTLILPILVFTWWRITTSWCSSDLRTHARGPNAHTFAGIRHRPQAFIGAEGMGQSRTRSSNSGVQLAPQYPNILTASIRQRDLGSSRRSHLIQVPFMFPSSRLPSLGIWTLQTTGLLLRASSDGGGASGEKEDVSSTLLPGDFARVLEDAPGENN